MIPDRDGSPGQFLLPLPTQGPPPTQLLLHTAAAAGQIGRGPWVSPPAAVPLDLPHRPPGQLLFPFPTQAPPPTQPIQPIADVVVEIGDAQGIDMGDIEGPIPGLVQVGAIKPLSIQEAADLLQNPTTWLSDNKVVLLIMFTPSMKAVMFSARQNLLFAMT